MDTLELVSSLHALPEINPLQGDGIQFGPTCQNNQSTFGGDCLILTMTYNLNVNGIFQTVAGGICIGIGIGETNTCIGC